MKRSTSAIARDQPSASQLLRSFPLLFVSGDYPMIQAFRPDAGEKLKGIVAKAGGPLVKCFYGDRIVLAHGEGVTRDREVALYDPCTLTKVGGLSGHSASILCLDPHPSASVAKSSDDSLFMVSGSKDSHVGIYRKGCSAPAVMFEGHSDIVLGVAWFGTSDTSSLVCSASNDCTVRLWDVVAEMPLPDGIIRQSTGVKCVRFHEGVNCILACSYDQTIRMYSVGEGFAVRKTFRAERGSNVVRPHSTDANLFFVGGTQGLITLWDIRRESRYVYSRHLHVKDRRVVVQDIVSIGQGQFASCAAESDFRIRIWNEHLDPSLEFGEIETDGKNFGLASLVPLQPRSHPCAIGVPSPAYSRVLVRDAAVTVSSMIDELRRQDRKVADAQKIAGELETEEEGEGGPFGDAQVEMIQSSVEDISSRIEGCEIRMEGLESSMAAISSVMDELKRLLENLSHT